MASQPHVITFDDLYIQRGTLEMAFHPDLPALDGSAVVISGVMAPCHDHFDSHHAERNEHGPLILMDDSGHCPDCAPVPVATVEIVGLDAPPPECIPGQTVLTVRGRLEYGFAVDSAGNASFVRVTGANIVRHDGVTA
jgi:hypothetical protein